MIQLPEWIRLSRRMTLCFSISHEMVEAFSVLTGDRSALHVSEEFARRSAYRNPIVHGMLPVAFIAMVENLDVTGKACRLTWIEAQFSIPVYLDEMLELSVEPAAAQESDVEFTFDFHIQKSSSGAMVTSGAFKVSYEDEPCATQIANAAQDGVVPRMLTRSLDSRNMMLEELSAGVSDDFEFLIGCEALHAFIGILIKGLRDQDAWPSSNFTASFIPNQLAITLLSTFVGMRIPGRSATFLGFSAQLKQQIRCEERYRFEGKVGHVSRATGIAKAAITIRSENRPDGEAAVLGRVSALVNRPFQGMPTAKALKTSAMDWSLKDKVVLITGASRGIGETTAKLFGLFGSKVIVNFYRGKDDAERVVQEINQEGGTAIAVGADVTLSDDVERMVNQARACYGAIHVLINNAVRDFRPSPFSDLTWEDIQKDLDVTVKGAFYCCKAVIPHMVNQGGGKIINISTVAVDDPPPHQVKYVLAKSALQGLTRSLAAEFASKNIQVNTVVPSFVETDLVAHIQESFRKQMARETPMQRHASSIDVAQAVLFLASSFSSYTTGQKIMLTGGRPPFL